MTDAVQIAIIASIPATIAAVASVIGSIISSKNNRDIGQVHRIVNGQQRALMKVAKSDSFRRGKAAEKAHPGSKVRKSSNKTKL